METRRHIRSCNQNRDKAVKARKKRKVSLEPRGCTQAFESVAKLALGDDVLVRASDGLLYVAKITRIDEKTKRYCVLFPEGKWDMWALFKDVQKSPDIDDIDCVICGEAHSEAGNEIVLCDTCGKGYHQSCHLPPVKDKFLDENVEWDCKECAYLVGLRANSLELYFKSGSEDPLYPVKKYQKSDLHWDKEHRTNDEQCYCYCGGPGQWFVKMLQCCRCQQWFHEVCVNCLQYPLNFGDTFFVFVCCWCNEGREYLQRLPLSWKQLAHLVLFNLTMTSPKLLHHFDQSIAPWLAEQWSALQLDSLHSIGGDKWKRILLKVLNKYSKLFRNGKETRKVSKLFALRGKFPPLPRPFAVPLKGVISERVMANLSGVATVEIVVPKCKLPLTNLCGMQRVRQRRKLSHDGDNAEQDDASPSQEDSEQQAAAGAPDSTPAKRYSHPTIATPLGRIFPRPCSYDGHNHPFKTVLEQKVEVQQREARRQLLDAFFESVLESTADNCENESNTALEEHVTIGDKFPIANGILSENNNNIEVDKSLPVGNQPILTKRGKRGRKPKSENQASALNNELKLMSNGTSLSATTMTTVGSRLRGMKRNRSQLETTGVNGSQQLSLKKLHSSLNAYFGGASRIAEGERFTVLAKRSTPDGRVEYLIDWA